MHPQEQQPPNPADLSAPQPDRVSIATPEDNQAMENAKQQAMEELYKKAFKDNTPNELLKQAVEDGNLEATKFLLTKGADPNMAIDSSGKGPVSLLWGTKDPAMAELLLEHGADVNKKDAFGDSLIRSAVKSHDGEMAGLFLKHKADPYLADDEGRTILHEAVQNRDTAIVSLILKSSGPALANQKDKNGHSPLNEAIESLSNNGGLAELLLQNGADANASRSHDGADNVTLLHEAASQGRSDVVRLLLEYGADPKAKLHVQPAAASTDVSVNPEGSTPLHMAAGAQNDDIRIADMLIGAKADVNERNGSGQTPLMKAAEAKNIHMVEYLLARGADMDAKDKDGKTALDYARQKAQMKGGESSTQADKKNINDYLDPENQRDNLNKIRTLPPRTDDMSQAAIDATQDMVDNGYAVAKGFNVSDPARIDTDYQKDAKQNESDKTRSVVALLEEVRSGERTAKNRVLDMRPDPVAVLDFEKPGTPEQPVSSAPVAPADKTDPFYDAVITKNTEEVRRLLASGKGDVNARYGDSGMTPLMFATENNDKAMIQLLREAGADPNAVDIIGRTALHHTVDWGSAAAVEALTQPMEGKAAADVKIRDSGGMTAFDWAKANGDYAVMGKLALTMQPETAQSDKIVPAYIPSVNQAISGLPAHPGR